MGWVLNITPWLLHPWKREPVPTVQDAKWTSQPFWAAVENLAPRGFKPWTTQPIVSHYTHYTNPATRQRWWHPNSSRWWEGLSIPVWTKKRGANQQESYRSHRNS